MKLSSIFEQYNRPEGKTRLVVSTLKNVVVGASDPNLIALLYLMKYALPVCSLYVKRGWSFLTHNARHSDVASTLLTIVRYSI